MVNPFKKVVEFFRTKSFYTTFGSFLFREQAFQPVNRDYLDAYKASFLVHSCIRKIAEKVAVTELKLYEMRGDKVEETDTHDILDLIARPTPSMTKFDFLDEIAMDLELLGNAYILKIKGDRSKLPVQLWLLRPDWIKIVPSNKTDNEIEYQYSIPGIEMKSYLAEEIIHIKQPNPESAYYGLPTIRPALELVKNLVYATRWNKNFFYNSARPDFLIMTKTKMSQPEKDNFKEMWYKQFGGLEKSHNFGILSGSEAEIKTITPTSREMEFVKLTDMMIQQILAAFGVPKTIVGMTTDVNRATSEAAIYTFLSETIEPKVRRIIDKLNEFLVPEFGENLFLDFVDPTPENREAVLLEYDNALKNNWMVINEVRDMEGLPPLEGGWDFYLPLTLTPAGGLKEGKKMKGIKPAEYKAWKEEKEQKYLKKKILEGKRVFKAKERFKSEVSELLTKSLLAPLRKRQEIQKWDKDKKDAFWKEHDKLLMADEKLFMALVVGLLQEQAKRVLKALKDKFGKKGKYDLIDWNKEKRVFAEISFAVFEDITMRRGKRMADILGFIFEMTESVRRFIDKKSLVFADQVNETTKKKIKEALKEGVGAGEGVGELTKRINELFKSREKWEAERIARTEVLDASSWADIEAYKQSGIVEKKEWLISPGACEICAPLDGEKVDLDKNFDGKFYKPPAHPNCKCTTLPWFEGMKASKETDTEKEIDIEKIIDQKIKEAEKGVDERMNEKINKIEKTIDEALE